MSLDRRGCPSSRLLGQMLLKRRLITAEELGAALREQGSGGEGLTLGKILLRRGSLTPERLERMLEVQETIRELETETPSLRSAWVGRYRLCRRIAQGGMGVVFEAEDARLHRPVALKIIPHEEGDERSMARRAEREAAIAGRLRHPNIVSIFDVGTARDTLGKPISYIVMEYVEGRTLEEMVEDLNTETPELLRILEKVARAVAYAHGQGVLHRDLKLGNVLVQDDGRVVLTDFGLARDREALPRITESGWILGTPLYMAPEQIEGNGRRTDAATDVYALGVMMYEILTRRAPFPARTLADLYRQILEWEPIFPSDGSISQDARAVCRKAMDKDRGKRYPSALEFAEDLERVLKGEPVRACPPSLFYRWRRALRRRWDLVVTAAVSGAVALTLSWAFHARRTLERSAGEMRLVPTSIQSPVEGRPATAEGPVPSRTLAP